MGQAWWNKERKEAYKSTNYHCKACGVHKEKAKYRQVLEGHEVYDTDYIAGRLTYLYTIPLCISCHQYLHMGRLHWLLSSGKITHARFTAIIQHGDEVLRQAGLSKFDKVQGDEGLVYRWSLVVEGEVIATS